MGNIRIRVAVIIELLDRMTGAPVKKGQVYIQTPGGQKMIQKEDGCFVFLHPFVGEQQIRIESFLFRPRTLKLSVAEEEVKHLAIWLEPNQKYLYPAGTTFLEGDCEELEAYESVMLIPARESRGIRLSADYKKGEDRISMYGITEKVEQRKYVLWQDDAPASEVFTIKANGEHAGEYILEKPLGNNYRKGEIQVRNVYETELDAKKHLYAALKNIEGNTQVILMAKGKIKRTIDITAHKGNTL